MPDNAASVNTRVVCWNEAAATKLSVLSAAFLGLLAFSKDDGIFLALMCLVSFFMFLKPQALFKNRAFWLTLAGVTLAVILVELFMRTHVLTRAGHIVSNRYLADPEQFFMLERWQEIGSYVWNRIILHAEFGRLRLWLPLLGVGLFYPAGRFILFSILGYFAVFFFLYAIVATDLAWRLDVTLDRLLFQVLPAMVFVLFHSLFRHKA